MSLADTGGEYVSAAYKVAPPIGVTGVAVAGYSLQEWVLVATLIYTVLMTANLIYKWVKGRS